MDFALRFEKDSRAEIKDRYRWETAADLDEVSPKSFAAALGWNYPDDDPAEKARLLVLERRRTKLRSIRDLELLYCDSLAKCLAVFSDAWPDPDEEPDLAHERQDLIAAIYPFVRQHLNGAWPARNAWEKWKNLVEAGRQLRAGGDEPSKEEIDEAVQAGKLAVEKTEAFLHNLFLVLHPARWPILTTAYTLRDMACPRIEKTKGTLDANGRYHYETKMIPPPYSEPVRGALEKALRVFDELEKVEQPNNADVGTARAALKTLFAELEAVPEESRGASVQHLKAALDDGEPDLGLWAYDETPYTVPDLGPVDWTGCGVAAKEPSTKPTPPAPLVPEPPTKSSAEAKPRKRRPRMTKEDWISVVAEGVKQGNNDTTVPAIKEAADVLESPPAEDDFPCEVSQAQAASDLGVTIRTIRNWEKGATKTRGGYSKQKRRTAAEWAAFIHVFRRDISAGEELKNAASKIGVNLGNKKRGSMGGKKTVF